MTNTKAGYGELLREARLARGLSVRKLAELVDGTASNILRFETEERRPSPDMVKRLARALKVNASELAALTAGPLPQLSTYLRAKYDLPNEAVAELEQHFKAVTQQYRPRK